MNTIRVKRKIEHLQLARGASQDNQNSLLGDINLIPCSLGDLSMEDIDLGVNIGGRYLEVPIIINAMTGGCKEAAAINQRLASLAAATGLGMAVGSQRAGLDDPTLLKSYQVVREVNPQGLIWANLSALATTEEAVQAINMIAADGIQLHLNQAQELAMPEGERSFFGLENNLRTMVQQLSVPIIPKQVGNGMAREEIVVLQRLGITIVDISGVGGTNFISIENQRGGLMGASLENWGLPTAISLAESLSVSGIEVIASGGIRSALDVARCLAFGAQAVGMALPFLHLTTYSDEEMLAATKRFIYQLKCVLLLCGARNIEELRQRPLVITGKTREWIQYRGLVLSPR